MNDDDPLNPGERWMLAGHVSRFLQSWLESPNSPRTRRAERRLARLLARYYPGRQFTMSGWLIASDDLTPPGTIRIRALDSLD